MTARTLLAVALAAATALAATSCGRPDPEPPRLAGSQRPYVVSAVDYHFHDAHPSKPIALDRGLVVANEGSNLHNVTFRRVGYDRNVRPGKELRIEAISELLRKPGRYPFICKFHADRGMAGVLVVVAASET